LAPSVRGAAIPAPPHNAGKGLTREKVMREKGMRWMTMMTTTTTMTTATREGEGEGEVALEGEGRGEEVVLVILISIIHSNNTLYFTSIPLLV
jgi:hypothetical protein